MKSVIFNPFWFLLFLADNFLPFRDLRNIGLFGELKTLNRLLVPFQPAEKQLAATTTELAGSGSPLRFLPVLGVLVSVVLLGRRLPLL